MLNKQMIRSIKCTYCFCLPDDFVSRANCSSDRECHSLDSVVVGPNDVANCVIVATVMHFHRYS